MTFKSYTLIRTLSFVHIPLVESCQRVKANTSGGGAIPMEKGCGEGVNIS